MALFYNNLLTSEDRYLEVVFKMDITRLKKKFLRRQTSKSAPVKNVLLYSKLELYWP